jgi:predicted RNA-binding protein
MEKNPREETMVVIPPEDTLVKIINASIIKRRRKAMQTISVPLKAHQTASSSNVVSIPRALVLGIVALLIYFGYAAFDAEILISWC